MASSAISAQGTTLGISTGVAPAAVNLSSVTVTATANGTITTFVTATPHGMVDGAYETFSGVTGADAALLNGLTFAISYISSTSFSIQLNTFGKTLTVTSATVTGTNYALIGNLRSYSGLDGQASEIDVTNLSSLAKEIRLGLVDYGQIQVEIDHNIADAGQARALVAYNAGSIQQWVLTLPNGDTAAFNGFARKFSLQGGVDQVVRRQLDIRISGPVTWC